MSQFALHEKFYSFAEFEQRLAEFERTFLVKYSKRESRGIHNHRLKCTGPPNPDLVYAEVKYHCMRGGIIRRRGTGKRRTSTYKIDCPAYIRAKVSKDGKTLEVHALNNNHNHNFPKELYEHMAAHKVSRREKRISQKKIEAYRRPLQIIEGGSKTEAILTDGYAGVAGEIIIQSSCDNAMYHPDTFLYDPEPVCDMTTMSGTAASSPTKSAAPKANSPTDMLKAATEALARAATCVTAAESGLECFGRYLVSELKAITDRELLLETKRAILGILNDAQIAQLHKDTS